MTFFSVYRHVPLSCGCCLVKNEGIFFESSFSYRSSWTSTFSVAISADSQTPLWFWSMACSFLYVVVQLPPV